MMKIRANRHELLLAAIVLLLVGGNIIWFSVDKVPPMWDQSHYLYISQLNYSALTSGGLAALTKSFLLNLQIKAPLITVLPIPLYLILGNSYTSALCINLVFTILGSYLIFKIGILAYGKREAVLSVIALNTMPLIIGLSREFFVEYGLTVFVVMWVFLILRSDSFQKRKWCVLLGVVLGLGMLMKISFALYIMPSLLLVILKIFEPRSIPSAVAKNAGIVLLIGFIIAGPWYVVNHAAIISFVRSAAYGEMARNYGMGEIFDLSTVLRYWSYLISYGISTYWFCLLVSFGVILSVSYIKRRKLNWPTRLQIVFVLWFLIPLVIFTFSANKDYRYTAPMYPVLGLWLGAGLSRISFKKNGVLAACVLLAFPIFNYLYVSFSNRPISLWLGPFAIADNNLRFAHPPRVQHWPLEKIIAFVSNDAIRKPQGHIWITLLFNHPYLNCVNLNYYSQLVNAALIFNSTDYYSVEAIEEVVDRISISSDYIMTKSGDIGPDYTNRQNIRLISVLQQGTLPFTRIAELRLPDETLLCIYRKNLEVYTSVEKVEQAGIREKKRVEFADRIRLLDYDVERHGQTYKLTFLWECLNQMALNYKVFVHIRSAEGEIIGAADHYFAGGAYPTNKWRRGEVIRDEITFPEPIQENFGIYIGIYHEVLSTRVEVSGKAPGDPDNTQGVRIYPSL